MVDDADIESREEWSSLIAELELLDVENARLRERLDESRRTKHQRAALVLALTGITAVVGAVLFPVARDVLLALGGTGLFAAVLVFYLTPERFVSADVGEQIYGALEADRSALIEELELREEHVYLPVEIAAGKSVRLFVPQHRQYVRPPSEDLSSLFVTPEDDRSRGVAFEPTGSGLFDELRRTIDGGFANDPEALARQVADGLVESFELVEVATPDVDERRISIAVTNSAYGPVDRFDHPIPSIVGTTLASVLDSPITLEVTDAADADYLITCRWE